MVKKSDDKEVVTTNRPVDLAEKLTDFPLPVADEAEAKIINMNPGMARAVAHAIGDLLSGLPTVEDDGINAAPIPDFFQEPRKPQTLPVPVTHLPALPGCDPIRWRQVQQLPGYQSRPIRSMGNDIFNAFPCFRAFAEEAKARRLDAHGQVLTVSDFTHDRPTVNFMAKLIAEKGTLLDVAQLDYGDRAPGYRPRIALLMTETWTFKLVQDKVEDGAPVNANFIYAWPGGARFYRPKLAPQPTGYALPSRNVPKGLAHLEDVTP